jgi:hypothetical protein
MTKLIIDLITSKNPLLEDSDPCWDNYKQIGLKKKNGKTVPNCVPEDINPADKGEYDNEGSMAKTQLRGIVADASHMIKMFSDEQNLPEWVQNKITKAADYLQSAHSYMMNKDEPIQEKTNMKKIKVSEKLSVSDGMGAWIKDFQDSDAPQFADADEDERRTMAIAAYLAAKREAKSGVVKEEVLHEAINADDYTITVEKSKFGGGYRPKIVHKIKNTVMYLSQYSYKTDKLAMAHAKAYLDAYEKLGMYAADRAASTFAAKNKQHTVEDNTTESTSKYAQSANKILDDLKKANISAADKAKLAQLADLMAKMKEK